MKQIEDRLNDILLNKKSIRILNSLREDYKNLLKKVHLSLGRYPETELALMNIEQSWMWVNKSLQINQEDTWEPNYERNEE